MDIYFTRKNEIAKQIIEAIDYHKMVSPLEYPNPGEYIITGLQAGNHNGEGGWGRYFGYVVQVRRKAGVFGSDVILVRHFDGVLIAHENQSYCYVNEYWKEKIMSLYEEDFIEDYSLPYFINGEFPEIGKIIGPNDGGYHGENAGSISTITVKGKDGTKIMETII